MPADADKLLKKLSALRTNRAKWVSLWNSVAKYFFPEAAPVGVISSMNHGNRKYQPLDTIGIDCSTLLAAFIYSNTIYSGEQWFDLVKSSSGKDSDTSRAETELLQKLVQKALELISNSNFDHVYRQFVNSYVPFGTGLFHWELDGQNELVCRQWLITANVYLAESAKGTVDTVFREFEYTARQAVQQFGYDNVSKEIKSAFDDASNTEKRFKFLNCVYPRDEGDIKKDKSTPKYKRFADIYIDEAERKVVLESGRDTFPYCATRFYNMGETYGRSPAMKALPALKAIAVATWAYLKNVEFNAKPMIFAPPQMYDNVKIEADTVNAWDSNAGQLQIWSPSGDMGSPLEFAEKKKDEVRRIFYVDRIQYLDEKKMTATEAQLRYDEMIQSFSPVLAALQSEFFTPFIEGLVQEIISRELVDIPKSLLNGDSLNFKVDYKSRLNAKLKGAFNANIVTFTRLVAEYGQAKGSSPVAAVYLNDDKIIKEFAKNCNVLGLAVNDDETIEANIQAQVQQAQQAQMAETMRVKPIDTQATPAAGSLMDSMING